MIPIFDRLRQLVRWPDWFCTNTGRAAVSIGVAVVAIKIAAAVAWMDPRAEVIALAAALLVAVALAFVTIVPGLRDEQVEPRLRRIWIALAAALAMGVLGAVSHGCIDWAGSRPESTGIVVEAIFSLAGFGLLAWAMLRIPATPLRPAQWIPIGLDLASLLLAGLLGFWIYALRPVLFGPERNLPACVLVSGFAIASLVLLGSALLVLSRRSTSQVRRATIPLVPGVTLLVALEGVPICHQLVPDSHSSAPGFAGWGILAVCTALGAAWSRRPAVGSSEEPPPEVRSALPFASMGLVAFLLSTVLVSGGTADDSISVLLPATFAALVLIVVRQTLIAGENHRMAQQMRQAKEVAESANSSRLQFLANISHDLRTPLNGVLGCAQILLRTSGLDAQQRDLLKTMQGCAEHLRNLINDLLDLSKLEADRLELAPSDFDFSAFLAGLLKTFSLEAENKNIALTLEPEPGLVRWITCDRKRLQQILGNLVHNAIKFTDRGGVTLHVATSNGELRIDVRDTGCGILPDKINDLFQPFHVVDERSIQLEGTGLGLSIAQKLARKMGGRITVQSVLGKGSTFTLRLPLQEAQPVIEVNRTVVDYQGRRRRILIVDDRQANRVVLRTMLEPLDFLIDEAADARSAMEHLRFARPDVILMDLMMPGVDGFDLCRQVAALELEPPPVCLAVSAVSGDEVRARCLETGFRELLNKPVHFELLLEALHLHAGIEWTYGIIEPPPTPAARAEAPAELVAPPPAEVAIFLDLARRGFVRNLEIRAGQLEQTNPEYQVFARRVAQCVREFRLRELTEWLTSLSAQPVHGSS